MTNQTTEQHRLAGAMNKRGLTHRRVAVLLDKPEGTISNWARGHVPRPDSQQKLVEVLNDAGQDQNLPELKKEDLWN